MDKTLVFGLPKNSKVVSIVRTDTCTKLLQNGFMLLLSPKPE
jgi:hypothetical protein